MTDRDLSGPAQYAQAVGLVDKMITTSGIPGEAPTVLALAQVHATLALAAAVAALIPEKDSQGIDNSDVIEAWVAAGAINSEG